MKFNIERFKNIYDKNKKKDLEIELAIDTNETLHEILEVLRSAEKPIDAVIQIKPKEKPILKVLKKTKKPIKRNKND